MMVGRELSNLYPPKRRAGRRCAEVVLAVRGVSTGDVHDVSFDLRKGEILGFAGLVGSGRTGVAEAIVGLAHRALRGEVERQGRQAFPRPTSRSRSPRASPT